MSGFLLDTNFVSEMVQVQPSARVVAWSDSADEELLFLSVLTLGEIRQGLASLPPSRKRTRLEAWLEVELRTRFAGRILPVDDAIAHRWGYLSAEARRTGRPVTVVDVLLAATALEHNLTMVTRNVRDFSRLGVLVLNPWLAP